ncbi:hypothetical protein HELRODRAFT_193022 [Helobdella robusta]|uniref:Uncharacterized protein n=1 Tax=Helobdella robusta TaxID=6412 RepID=T1FUJ1_HELRO|nr:hypothetical protein HELRODRAFT_193022 [Helobdella robusta]ESN98263.1 hypothetical protein HELRODRAFT_193022 [Helobdella robusta]
MESMNMEPMASVDRLTKLREVLTSKKEGLSTCQSITFWLLIFFNVTIIVIFGGFIIKRNFTMWRGLPDAKFQSYKEKFFNKMVLLILINADGEQYNWMDEYKRNITGDEIARISITATGRYLIHSRVAYECRPNHHNHHLENQVKYYTHQVRVSRTHIQKSDRVDKIAVTGIVDPPQTKLICYDSHIIFEAEATNGSEVTSHSDEYLYADLEVVTLE